jgi:hypothetical protein
MSANEVNRRCWPQVHHSFSHVILSYPPVEFVINHLFYNIIICYIYNIYIYILYFDLYSNILIIVCFHETQKNKTQHMLYIKKKKKKYPVSESSVILMHSSSFTSDGFVSN